MAEGFFIQRKDQIQYLVARLEELLDAGGVVSVDLKNGRTRTGKQQAALEVWCRATAELLNEAGMTRAIQSPIYRKGELECSWKQWSVKDEIWRPMQKAIVDVESTADCSTTDYPKVYDELNRAMSERLDVSLPNWPTRFDHVS